MHRKAAALFTVAILFGFSYGFIFTGHGSASGSRFSLTGFNRVLAPSFGVPHFGFGISARPVRPAFRPGPFDFGGNFNFRLAFLGP